jgi:hypothetical protein
VEIQQQADTVMAHARIGRDLRFVCRDEGRDAFDFNNNGIRDRNIRAKPGRDRYSFVNHREAPGPKGNAGALKFQAQTGLIDGFGQTRPDRPVNLDRQ